MSEDARSAHALLTAATAGRIGPVDTAVPGGGSGNPDKPDHRRARATGESVAVRREVDPADSTYHPESNQVELTLGSGEHAVTDTVSFEVWAETEAALVAAEEAARVARSRLDGDATLSAGIDADDDPGTVRSFVALDYRYDEGDSLVADPGVAFDDVVAVTPERVTATVVFAGQEYAETAPIHVQREVVRAGGDG